MSLQSPKLKFLLQWRAIQPGNYFKHGSSSRKIITTFKVIETGTNNRSLVIKKLHSLTWKFPHQKLKIFFNVTIFLYSWRQLIKVLRIAKLMPWHHYVFRESSLHRFPGKQWIRQNKRSLKKTRKKKRYVNNPRGWLWFVTHRSK